MLRGDASHRLLNPRTNIARAGVYRNGWQFIHAFDPSVFLDVCKRFGKRAIVALGGEDRIDNFDVFWEVDKQARIAAFVHWRHHCHCVLRTSNDRIADELDVSEALNRAREQIRGYDLEPRSINESVRTCIFRSSWVFSESPNLFDNRIRTNEQLISGDANHGSQPLRDRAGMNAIQHVVLRAANYVSDKMPEPVELRFLFSGDGEVNVHVGLFETMDKMFEKWFPVDARECLARNSGTIGANRYDDAVSIAHPLD